MIASQQLLHDEPKLGPKKFPWSNLEERFFPREVRNAQNTFINQTVKCEWSEKKKQLFDDDWEELLVMRCIWAGLVGSARGKLSRILKIIVIIMRCNYWRDRLFIFLNVAWRKLSAVIWPKKQFTMFNVQCCSNILPSKSKMWKM